MAKNGSEKGKAEFVQDEIIVKFKGDVRPFRVIKIPEGKVGEKIKEYLKRADVEYTEPNFIAYALMVPNDPYYGYQWHLDNPVYGGIQMEETWDISTGSPSVIVAIVDTGIAYENYGKFCQAPDLAQTSFVAGYDFVNNDTHPNDDNRHGIHVAGKLLKVLTIFWG
jgi:serine protease